MMFLVILKVLHVDLCASTIVEPLQMEPVNHQMQIAFVITNVEMLSITTIELKF